jgi:hypothetical protein
VNELVIAPKDKHGGWSSHRGHSAAEVATEPRR